MAALQRNLELLPEQLKLPAARMLAQPRLAVLRDFLQGAQAEQAVAGVIEGLNRGENFGI